MIRQLVVMTCVVVVGGCCQRGPDQRSDSTDQPSKTEVAQSANSVSDRGVQLRMKLASDGHESVIEWEQPFVVSLFNETDRPIRIWDPKTGKGPEVTRLPTLMDPGFAAGGKSVVVLDQANKIHTFDITTGAPGKAIELPVEVPAQSFAWWVIE